MLRFKKHEGVIIIKSNTKCKHANQTDNQARDKRSQRQKQRKPEMKEIKEINKTASATESRSDAIKGE